jgi:hypothetical protein
MPAIILGIGSAVASGVGSIFGGKAQAAAARQRNEQATMNWIQSNTNKTYANAREQFQSVYNFEQQLKRNSAIAEAAYATQFESSRNLKDIASFQHRQLARQRAQVASSLTNTILSKGLSPSSGLFGALTTAQALDALNNSKQLQKNLEIQKNEINKQFKAQMSTQTENIFMPNIQGYDQAPMMEDASAAETGGMVSGLLQIGSAVGAGAMGAFGGPAQSGGTNKFGTDLSKAPSQYGTWLSSSSGSSYSPSASSYMSRFRGF